MIWTQGKLPWLPNEAVTLRGLSWEGCSLAGVYNAEVIL